MTQDIAQPHPEASRQRSSDKATQFVRTPLNAVSLEKEVRTVRTFQVVVERDPETGLLIGYVPGWPGAHTQAASNNELEENLREVIGMLLEDGEPWLESEFVGVRTIQVA
jgi:predicted RNase H-like HicB family nuclease